MKVTRIKALCKAEKCCIIYDQLGERQMIGTESAAYPVDHLMLTKDSIRTLFDWPDVANELRIETMQLEESRLHPGYAPCFKMEQLRTGMPISYIDETIIPLMAGNRILFVRADYVNAAEKTEGYAMYYLAQNGRGEPLVVLGDGLFITAIIRPLPKRTAESVRTYLRSMADFDAWGWPDENAKDSGQLPGQMSMEEMQEDETE